MSRRRKGGLRTRVACACLAHPGVLLGFALVLLGQAPARAQEVVREWRVFEVGAILEARSHFVGADSSLRAPRLGVAIRESDDDSISFDGAFDEEAGLDGEELLDLIWKHVASDSWRNERNSLRLVEGRLFVHQTSDVLEELAGFLAELEGHVSRVHRADLAIVPLAALDAVDATWRSDSAAWDGPPERFEAVARAAGERLVWLSAAARPGHVERFGREGFSSRIVDHQVNQTGMLPVPAPRRGFRQSGLHGSLNVLPLPVVDRVRVDLRVGIDRGSFVRSELPSGDVDLPVRGVEALSTSLVARLDRTTLVAVVELPQPAAANADAPSSFAVLLRVRAPNAAGLSSSTRVLAIDVQGLITPWTEHEPPALSREDDDNADSVEYETEHTSVPLEEDELLEGLSRSGLLADEDEVDIVDGLVFVSTSGDGGPVREWLREQTRARLASRTVEVWRGLVDTLPDVTSGAALEASWGVRLARSGGGRVVVRLAGAGEARVDVAREFTYLANVYPVVAGVGVVARTVIDPAFEVAAAGLSLRFCVRAVAPSRWLRLEIDAARVGAIERGEKRKVRDPLGEEDVTYEIETPTARDAEEWRHRVIVTHDAPILLAVTPDLGGATQARVVRVRRLPAE